MTNNNFNIFLGCFLTLSNWVSLSDIGILKYDGTNINPPSIIHIYSSSISQYFNIIGTFGETNQVSNNGMFLTLGTDNTPPTKSDLKLGNSVEDFVWVSGSILSGKNTNSNDLLMFNSVVNYRGSSPIIIKEMGLNCMFGGHKCLFARETIEPLVINPDDTYSFVMRIK